MRGDYVSPGNTPVKNEQRRTENLWRDLEFKFGSTHLPFNDFKKEKLKRFKVAVGLNRFPREIYEKN